MERRGYDSRQSGWLKTEERKVGDVRGRKELMEKKTDGRRDGEYEGGE